MLVTVIVPKRSGIGAINSIYNYILGGPFFKARCMSLIQAIVLRIQYVA